MTTATDTLIPTGRYEVYPAHSNIDFSVKHLGIATVHAGSLGQRARRPRGQRPARPRGLRHEVHQVLGSGNALVSDRVKLRLDISAVKA